ncbi:hypothetical protein CAPTEDRAFT_204556 [Capitella teleta]|uniref:Fibrinogen C-terminal domain-containing protein n=1 Tax=Capitella teleta TaxID=283909 RepID=R7U4B2_CAPTE|nr:hypothetical protein CAPTEDRAFT_204556 [Capitella teleta]|eukprot:ELT98010.1 hypothetical protein CAPTEDRAFT_204556 [Capitella teleta]
MESDGGGWMVFQRRYNGSEEFYRDWQDYADGFGSIASEFWLGNDLLHNITASHPHKMRVDLEDFEGNSTYAEYTDFSIADAGDFYRLHIAGYSGTAGDSMLGHNGHPFTTKDADHDTSAVNCAVNYRGAWWYTACHKSNLNGAYLGGIHSSYADGIEWFTFRGHYYSLKYTEMKIQPM